MSWNAARERWFRSWWRRGNYKPKMGLCRLEAWVTLLSISFFFFFLTCSEKKPKKGKRASGICYFMSNRKLFSSSGRRIEQIYTRVSKSFLIIDEYYMRVWATISLAQSSGNFQETRNETLRTTWMPYKNSRWCSSGTCPNRPLLSVALSLSHTHTALQTEEIHITVELSPIGDELFEFAALYVSSLASPVNNN